ncbi:MAG: sulfatase [Gemmatales bacterium]|nr:MAG: sulfatase [Gemmatales bacterium]
MARPRASSCSLWEGGPSQVDTFDPKPLLARLNGKDVPESIAKDIPRIARAPLTNLYASPYQFKRHGQSGIPVSEIFPEIGQCIDDICVLRSCRHNSPIHAPAEYMALTGTPIGDRPSLGSWIYYGLGSDNKNLPGFVVLLAGRSNRRAGWSSGFLPAQYQATVAQATGIPNLTMPTSTTANRRLAQLEFIAELNRRHHDTYLGGSDLEARIQSYELAYRMQSAAPEAFDLSKETRETKQLYGIGDKDTNEFGTYCLLARRLVERGVRFVQIRSGGWDAHGNLRKNHDPQAKKTDKPIAGLLRDLKRTGLLERTLVVWGGEFGRTPTAENPGPTPGRNHSPSGYSMWLAGGGVKGGQVIGATDPVGYAAIERPIHPNDLHATILHAFGIHQKRLFFSHNNRRELVTVNGGQIIHEVFGS